MKKFLKFTKGRRGSNASLGSQKSGSVAGSTSNLDAASTSGDHGGSTVDLRQRSGSVSSFVGYQIGKEKDLPKIHKAAWTGDLKKVQNLAKKDPNILDKENRTALHLAAARGHDLIVEELIAWNCKINVADNQNRSPLSKAVDGGHVKCSQLLLESGAEVNTPDKDGLTCLHLAAQAGNTDLIKLLVDYKANVEAKTKLGHTCLHLSVLEDKLPACRLLLDMGATPDVTDEERKTPLMHACHLGQEETVRLLIERQADATIKDVKGWTAEDCAVIAGHHSCAALIVDYVTEGRSEATPTRQATPRSTTTTPRQNSVVSDRNEDLSEMDPSLSETSRRERINSWADSDDDESLGLGLKAKASDVKVSLNKFVKLSDNDESTQSGVFNKKEPSKSKSAESPGRHVGFGALEKDDRGRGDVSFRSQDSVRSEKSLGSWNDDESLGLDSEVKKPALMKQPQITIESDFELSDDDELPVMGLGSSPPRKLAQETPEKGNSMEKAKELEKKKEKEKEKRKADLLALGLDEADDVSEFDDVISDVDKSDPGKSPRKRLESDWDSTHADESLPYAPTPRSANQRPPTQLSDWDSTEADGDAFTPRTPRTDPDGIPEMSEPDFSAKKKKEEAEKMKHQMSQLQDEVKETEEEKDDVFEGEVPVFVVKELEEIRRRRASLVGRQNSRPSLASIVSDWDSTETDPGLPAKALVSHDATSPVHEINKRISSQESNWDSDEDSVAEGMKQGTAIFKPADLAMTPPAPAAVTSSAIVTSDKSGVTSEKSGASAEESEETISEWEIERKRQRELNAKLSAAAESPKRSPIAAHITTSSHNVKRNDVIGDVTDGVDVRNGDDGVRGFSDDEEGPMLEIDMTKPDSVMIMKYTMAASPAISETMSPVTQVERKDSNHGNSGNNSRSGTNVSSLNSTPSRSIHKSEAPSGFSGNAFGDDDIGVVDTKIDEPKTPTSPISPTSPDGLDSPRRQFSLSQADASKKLKRLEHALSLETTEDEGDRDSICDVPDSPRDPLLNRRRSSQWRTMIPARDITTPLGSYIHCVLGKTSPVDTQFLSDNDVINRHDVIENKESANSLQSPEVESVQLTPRGSDPLNQSWTNLDLSNASELSASMQLKDQLREQKLQLDRETSLRSGAELKAKSLDNEKKDYVHKISGLNKLKANLEQKVIDLEAQIRSLQYNLSEESEKRKSAELLQRKTKDQLDKKDEKFNEESDARQKSEVNVRNLMMEVKTLKSKVSQLEDDRENLSQQLDHEKSARSLSEQMHQDQVKAQYQSLQQASPDIDISSMEPAEGAKLVRETCDKLKTELYSAQMELDRTKSHQKEDHQLMVAENERLQKHVNDLKEELKLNQEALTQATMQHNNHLSQLKSDHSVLQSSADKERQARDKLETELESLKTRWQHTNEELTKTEAARAELERSLHKEQESLLRQKDRSELEISALKESNQQLTQRAHEAEKRAKALEADLAGINSSLIEKMNTMANSQREHGQMRMALDNAENALNKEKEERVKLTAKVEALQERNLSLASENQDFRQRIDAHQRESADKDRAVLEAQNKFTDLLQSVREDYDKSRAAMEDKNSSLHDTISSLKDQIRDSELRLRTMENDAKNLQHENEELRRQLTLAEVTAGATNRNELEEHVHKLEMENTRLESSLNHETERVENLRRDLQEAAKKHAALEQENQRLRSANDRLDERVAEETVTRTVHAQDALETRDLWQNELKSASILGKKLAQLEREKSEMAGQLDEEKNRVRTAAERERLVESKLETISEKNLELEKELAGLKAKLKMAKKTGAVLENGDMLTDTISGLRQQLTGGNQLNDVQGQINMEQSQPQKVQQLQQDLTALKAREKALLKAEKAKKKIEESYRQYQEHVQLNYVPRIEFDRIKSELESQARREINVKLDEVNNYLEQQASAREKLDQLRASNEQILRNNFLQQQKSMQEDLSTLRANYQDLLIQKTHQESEVHQLKTKYDSEHRIREKLEDRLYNSSPSPGKLTTDMLHRSATSPTVSPVQNGGGVVVGATPTSTSLTNEDLTQRIRNELNRSIAKHLETPSRKELNVPFRTPPDDAGGSYLKSTNDYRSILHKNYLL